MSNFYICGQCANRSPVIYPLVNCKAQPFPVAPIAAIDFGRRYVYMDSSGNEYEKPIDACMYFERKGNR